MLLNIPIHASVWKETNFSSGFTAPKENSSETVDGKIYSVRVKFKNKRGFYRTTAPSKQAAFNNAAYRFVIDHTELFTTQDISALQDYRQRALYGTFKKQVLHSGTFQLV
jgi:hypothetical protein